MEDQSPLIQPKERKFLPVSFSWKAWDDLAPYFDQLQQRPLENLDALESWLADWSELESMLSEEGAWRQIRLTLDTQNESYQQAFAHFVEEIEPQVKKRAFELHQKLLACPHHRLLPEDPYFPFIRWVKNQVALFREENIPLQSALDLKAQEFGQTTGKLTINYEGQTLTLQQAARYLEDPNRSVRQQVFHQIQEQRGTVEDALNDLFDALLQRRHELALNAGYANYRDYKFAELGRFDYSPEDCFNFHGAIKEHILPLHRQILDQRRTRLGLDKLRPWDTQAEPPQFPPLKPFSTGRELIDKSVAVFHRLDPYFAACIQTMDKMGRLDLESRVGKAPGGYNCPLADSGVPFIFMNAVGTLSDLITMMHEGGHAFHAFLSHELPLNAFKEYPMEMAELASMSMELFSMEHWDLFFDNPQDHLRAQTEELERVISVLPWIATIDAFQHWLYTNPGHHREERESEWLRLLDEFGTGLVDWQGCESYQRRSWQRQLHLFEVPFYYIEYGIAQVGAMAMWRQYKEAPKQTLERYKEVLKLGYTRPLPQLYETAGIAFDFSSAYLKELADFVGQQMAVLAKGNPLVRE